MKKKHFKIALFSSAGVLSLATTTMAISLTSCSTAQKEDDKNVIDRDESAKLNQLLIQTVNAKVSPTVEDLNSLTNINLLRSKINKMLKIENGVQGIEFTEVPGTKNQFNVLITFNTALELKMISNTIFSKVEDRAGLVIQTTNPIVCSEPIVITDSTKIKDQIVSYLSGKHFVDDINNPDNIFNLIAGLNQVLNLSDDNKVTSVIFTPKEQEKGKLTVKIIFNNKVSNAGKDFESNGTSTIFSKEDFNYDYGIVINKPIDILNIINEFTAKKTQLSELENEIEIAKLKSSINNNLRLNNTNGEGVESIRFNLDSQNKLKISITFGKYVQVITNNPTVNEPIFNVVSQGKTITNNVPLQFKKGILIDNTSYLVPVINNYLATKNTMDAINDKTNLEGLRTSIIQTLMNPESKNNGLVLVNDPTKGDSITKIIFEKVANKYNEVNLIISFNNTVTVSDKNFTLQADKASIISTNPFTFEPAVQVLDTTALFNTITSYVTKYSSYNELTKNVKTLKTSIEQFFSDGGKNLSSISFGKGTTNQYAITVEIKFNSKIEVIDFGDNFTYNKESTTLKTTTPIIINSDVALNDSLNILDILKNYVKDKHSLETINDATTIKQLIADTSRALSDQLVGGIKITGISFVYSGSNGASKQVVATISFNGKISYTGDQFATGNNANTLISDPINFQPWIFISDVPTFSNTIQTYVQKYKYLSEMNNDANKNTLIEELASKMECTNGGAIQSIIFTNPSQNKISYSIIFNESVEIVTNDIYTVQNKNKLILNTPINFTQGISFTNEQLENSWQIINSYAANKHTIDVLNGTNGQVLRNAESEELKTQLTESFGLTGVNTIQSITFALVQDNDSRANVSITFSSEVRFDVEGNGIFNIDTNKNIINSKTFVDTYLEHTIQPDNLAYNEQLMYNALKPLVVENSIAKTLEKNLPTTNEWIEFFEKNPNIISRNASDILSVSAKPKSTTLTSQDSNYINIEIKFNDYANVTIDALFPYNFYNIENNVLYGVTSEAFSHGYLDLTHENITSVASNAFYKPSSLINVTFPDTIAFPNTLISVSENAFNSSGFKNIILGNSLKIIEPAAFKDCKQLTGIDLSQTKVTNIPYQTFYGCSAMTSIKLPTTLVSIQASAFETNPTVTGEGGTTGGVGGGTSCAASQALELPASVTLIGARALNTSIYNSFSFATSSQLSYVGMDAFPKSSNVNLTNCTSLTTGDKDIIISNNSGVTFNPNVEGTKFDLSTQITTTNLVNNILTIPTDTTEIVGEVPQNQKTNIHTVSIPNQVVTIGDNAFRGCSSLSTITFDNANELVRIGKHAFEDTIAAEIKIPGNVKVVDNFAFSSTVKRNYTFISSTPIIEYIGQHAFEQKTTPQSPTIATYSTMVTKLEQLTSLKSLEPSAFSGVDLANSAGIVTIPASVLFVKAGSLNGIKTLKTITFSANSQLQYIGVAYNPEVVAFQMPEIIYNLENCDTYFKDENRINVTEFIDSIVTMRNNIDAAATAPSTPPAQEQPIQTWNTHGIKILSNEILDLDFYNDLNIPQGKLVIPSGTKYLIGSRNPSFKNTVTSVSVPTSLIALSKQAFKGCNQLTNIELQTASKIQEIPESCFEGCISLNGIELPKSTTIVKTKSFYNTPKLQNFKFYGECSFVYFENDIFVTNENEIATKFNKNIKIVVNDKTYLDAFKNSDFYSNVKCSTKFHEIINADNSYTLTYIEQPAEN